MTAPDEHTPRTTPAPRRSRQVTVLAWNLILAGGIIVLLTSVQLVILSALLPPDAMQLALDQVTGGMPVPSALLFFVGHVNAILASMFVVGFVTLVAGIGLLRRRAWARVMVIAMMWINILGHVIATAVPFFGDSSGTAQAPPLVLDARGELVVYFLVLMLVVAICLASAWVIRLLQSLEVRREFGAR